MVIDKDKLIMFIKNRILFNEFIIFIIKFKIITNE